MPLSRPFVIATEGPTIDGRNISADWIKQMAASYDPKVYTAVANLEHYLSAVPDSLFSAQGKVVSLSVQEATLMGEKKLQLMAVVDVNDAIVAMQKAGKKAFASIEVLNNFIGKGVAYLSGLAFTDTPASIGTESIKFSLAGAPGERYASNAEAELTFDTVTPPEGGKEGESLFAKVKELLGIGQKTADQRFADQAKAVEAIATSQKALLEQFAAAPGLAGKVEDQAKAITALTQELADLKTKLSTTESGTQRPPATGGTGEITTDC